MHLDRGRYNVPHSANYSQHTSDSKTRSNECTPTICQRSIRKVTAVVRCMIDANMMLLVANIAIF